MYAFADGLEYLDVNYCCTPVITVVFKLFVAYDTISAFRGCQGEGRAASYAGDDGANVEGEDRGVGVNFIRV